jgi:hypothetical protein
MKRRKRVYQKKDHQIVLTMTENEWASLLFLLGIASSWCHTHDPERFRTALALVNSLNQGNPDYRPYQISEKV